MVSKIGGISISQAKTLKYEPARLLGVISELPDISLANVDSIYSPESRTKIEDLKQVLSSDKEYLSRLWAASQLVCAVPDDEILTETEFLITDKIKQVELDNNLKGVAKEIPSQAEFDIWNNLLVGFGYSGQLSNQIIDAYASTFPVNGTQSSPEHAKNTLLQTLMSLILIQPKKNPLFTGMSKVLVKEHLDAVCKQMVQRFSEIFALDEEKVFEELYQKVEAACPTHRVKKVAGYSGQLSIF